MEAKMIRAAIAAICGVAVAIPAMAGTVLTVTPSGEGISVGVPAGAVDAESALYLVWDSEDHGDELAAWPVANRVAYDGVLSSSAATYYFATNCLPANYCARAIAAKAVNVIDGYILLGKNAAGNARCVNTGIPGNQVYGLDIKYQLPGTQTGGTTSGTYGRSLLSGTVDNGTIGQYNKELYMRWHNTDYGFCFTSSLFTSTDVHRIVVADGEAKVDVTTTKTGIPTATSMATTDKTMLMSAAWVNNNIDRFMHVNWYYARLYGKDGSALRDLVPALTNSNVAVFYDKVSHKYFGNANSDLVYSGSASETNFTLAASAAMSSVTVATWTGGGETALLSDAGNWTPGLPGVFSTATINGTGETPAVVPDGLTAYRILKVGAGGNGELVQSQGAITASGVNGVVVGSGAGNTGRYTMTGGTLTTGGTYGTDDAMYVGTGAGGTGYFEVGGNARVNLLKLNIGQENNSKGYVTVGGNGIISCRGDINVGSYQNCYGEVNQSRGIVTATNAWVKIPQYGGTGKYNISGGRLVVKGQTYVGYSNNSHGTLKQSGGEIYTTEDFSIGGYDSKNRGTGEAEMEGGSLTVDRYCQIGRYNTGTFAQSGGNVTCRNWTSIGRYVGGVGTCTVTGGTFTVTGGGIVVGENGHGTLTVGDAGVVSVTPEAGIVIGGGNATDGYGTGTFKVRTGGMVVAQKVRKGSGTVALLEFDGGTIRAKADDTILKDFGNIVLKAGGLVIDTQGHNLDVMNCVFNVVPGGKITVTGGGTVTFANCTASLTAKPSEKFLFAETDGVFSGMPTFTDTRGWKVRMSADSKKISVVPSGMVVIFR